MINVFVIDDHNFISEGIEFFLMDHPSEIHFAGSALNVELAAPKLERIDADVLILDLMIRPSDPVDNLMLLKKLLPGKPILIFSAEDSLYWKCRMFRAGANAFLCKASSNEVLSETILKIADGSIVVPNEVKGLINQSNPPDRNDFITLIELEICNQVGAGIAIKTIADNLDISESSIQKKLSCLRERFHAHSTPHLIKILINRNMISCSN